MAHGKDACSDNRAATQASDAERKGVDMGDPSQAGGEAGAVQRASACVTGSAEARGDCAVHGEDAGCGARVPGKKGWEGERGEWAWRYFALGGKAGCPVAGGCVV